MKNLSLVLALSLLAVVGCDQKKPADTSDAPAAAVPALANELRAPTAGRTGVADDGVKPIAKTGVPDDSVKPIAKAGVPDDSVKPVPVLQKPATPATPAPVPVPFPLQPKR